MAALRNLPTFVRAIAPAALARACITVLVALCAASPAYAHTFADPRQDFSVDVKPKGEEQLCVAIPPGQDDPRACKDVDLAPIRNYRVDGAAPIGFVYVIDVDRVFMVIVVREEGETPARDELDQVAQNLFRGYRESLPPGASFAAEPHTVRQVNGLTVIDAGGAVSYAPGSAEGLVMNHMRSAYVPVEGGGYAVMIAGMKGADGRFDTLFEETVATIKAKDPHLASSRLTKGLSRIAFLLVPIAVFTVVGGLVAVILLARSRKKNPTLVAAPWGAAPQVPPSPYYPPPVPPHGGAGYGPPGGGFGPGGSRGPG